ncbi:MAG: VWA domain-containing protein [Candidatus Sericytochromatia bacterium]|nr:VWA domain-containing protein [Candidatus Sericytochromatia bacterium]
MKEQNMSFTIESFYNPHLALGNNRTDAVLTIANSAEVPQGSSKLDFIYILDVSGSMNEHDKLNHAKIALRQSLSLLPSTASFSIIVFNTSAKLLIPLCQVSEDSIAKAQKAVKEVVANGGTAMSTALVLANKQFKSSSNTIKIAQFLTDGENDTNDSKLLLNVLDSCKGVFQCHCRGIGVGWRPEQLRLIAGSLLGSADTIGDNFEQDFKDTINSASNLGVANVFLRLWSPKSAKIISVKQVMPEITDLMKLAKIVDEKIIDFPLGSWGKESRDYHIGIELSGGVSGDEVLACRPMVIYEENGIPVKIVGPNVVASWTDNVQLTTRINSQVAHYTGQAELASSIKEGLEAQALGDIDKATKLLGKAVKIAADSGNEEVTKRLKKVVDIVDVSMGTVRIKSSANKADVLGLDMGGTRTVRRSKPPTNT